jgi:hypothetical protein
VRYTDDELLKIVGEERKRSIGFGEGESGELTTAREKALAYYKGEMTDIPSMPNRSKAVDTTVADAIETVLPDVMEVFIGGEDVATFVPQGQEDEDRAQEETDFVQHVVFTENEGFLVLYSAIKDSLLTRTGIIGWWWDEDEKTELLAEGLTAEMAAVGQQMQPQAQAEGEDGSISLSMKHLHGKVKIKAFPSEDFTVGRDTVSLKDATYCAVRDRPRVQELIARGFDPELCRNLSSYAHMNGSVEQERDGAGEHDRPSDDAVGDLRTVEVRAHYVRLADEDGGDLAIWRVITDGEEKVLLDKEKVDQIPFAALTPYIIPHRFYGESVADKLIQVQQIKTALLRMLLDSGYFALNQRNYVDMQQANEFTIADLLANEPGRPVRGKGPNGVTPLAAGALNFDVFGALEFASTMAEGRSGIVRNAQGLNPDTLHDTAKGAMALIAAAQKRVRMIARIFAETGIKDLFLGVHCMLREGYTDKHEPAQAKIRNSWKKITPNQWQERCAMTIHVGVGSAGKEHDLIIGGQRLEMMERLIGLQGGVDGPFVDKANVHNALSAWERAGGTKTPDMYWTDPANAPPQPPKPDPETEKAKAELALKAEEGKANLQLKQAEGQMKAQMDAEKGARDHELAVMKLESEMTLAREKTAAELQLKRETTEAELAMKRELLTAELEMKRETAYLNAEVARETGLAKAEASSSVSEVNAGGEPG